MGINLLSMAEDTGRITYTNYQINLNQWKLPRRKIPIQLVFLVNSAHSATFIVQNFIWNGQIYHCSEQYIQHQKAKYCGDTATANDIMSCKTALQCKRASRNIENYNSDDWIKHAESECIKGLLAKFDQNPKLKTILLNTKDKTIVKCSWDRVWGTGCPLSRLDCLDTKNWESPGLLGKLLMTVHEKLRLPIAEQHTMPKLPAAPSASCSENPTPSPAPMDTNQQSLTDHRRWKLATFLVIPGI